MAVRVLQTVAPCEVSSCPVKTGPDQGGVSLTRTAAL